MAIRLHGTKLKILAILPSAIFSSRRNISTNPLVNIPEHGQLATLGWFLRHCSRSTLARSVSPRQGQERGTTEHLWCFRRRSAPRPGGRPGRRVTFGGKAMTRRRLLSVAGGL